MLSIPDLLTGLGGATKVALLCRVVPSAPSNWVARGQIPAEHHMRLWLAATEAGLDWTPPGAEGLALVAKPQVAA